MFLDFGGLQVTETVERETTDKVGGGAAACLVIGRILTSRTVKYTHTHAHIATFAISLDVHSTNFPGISPKQFKQRKIQFHLK